MNKLKPKGVAPLIAEVILIVTVIIIAVILLVVARQFTSQNVEEIKDRTIITECSTNVDFDIIRLKESEKLCFDDRNNLINITLENKGIRDIKDIKAIIIGANDIYTKESLGVELKKGAIVKASFTYNDETYGTIKQVKLYPSIFD